MSLDSSNNNNKEVISKLYVECKTWVIGWLVKKGIQENEALDIYQNAVLVVAERFEKHGIDHFTSGIKSYLFSVTKYHYYDIIRKKNSEKDLIYDTDKVWKIMSVPSDMNMEIDLRTRILKDHLDRLDERSYRLLRLYYYEDKSMKEIAEIMGFSGEQVAKSTKYRIIQKLKKWLSEHESLS